MSEESKRPLVAVITGPTATGKTRLGVLLARELDGEVVSADSMQVYRGMDIGTAKPGPEEMEGVPHHMLDVAGPEENYSAARYAREASRCCEDILARGKLPVIVGGTGLYIEALLHGGDFAQAPTDPELRQTLMRRYDEWGGQTMLDLLAGVDPQRAARLSPADKKRVLRAIEVYMLTGKTMSELDEASRKSAPRFRSVRIALSFADRERLYRRIDRRVDEMAARGLFEEVRGLLEGGLGPDCTAMQAIGYKEAAQHLRGELSREEAIELIKRQSRRYAKRQLTWLRRDEGLRWLSWDPEPDFDWARRVSTEIIRSRSIQ